MSSFFNRENWIWKPFSWVADLLILSCLWFLCSVPLVTLGAATAALYDCAARCLRGGDEKMFTRFFKTFRRELVQSIPSLLLWCSIIGGGYFAVRAYGNFVAVTDASVALTVAMLLILTVLVGVSAWVFPLQSRFTFPVTQLNITAVKLALVHMPSTMLLGILTVLAGFLCAQFLLPVIILPGLLALVWTLPIECVFARYEENDEQ